MNLKITRAIVILRSGSDKVALFIDAPSPTPKVPLDEPSMSVDCEADYGETWCRLIGIENVEVVNTRFNSLKFQK